MLNTWMAYRYAHERQREAMAEAARRRLVEQVLRSDQRPRSRERARSLLARVREKAAAISSGDRLPAFTAGSAPAPTPRPEPPP